MTTFGVPSLYRQRLLALTALFELLGCGRVGRDASPIDTNGRGASAGAGSQQTAGAGGAPVGPVDTCETSSRYSGASIVEICGEDETCCSCGCGQADARCTQEPACSPSTGQRCGNGSCREGYVCCNAICGVCAKTSEECAVVPGRCESVGMDKSFDRCSDVLPNGASAQGLGTLEARLPRFRGRWLGCSREIETSTDGDWPGFDVTSDGRYFLLGREGEQFFRPDTPATRGTVVVASPGSSLPELDFHAETGIVVSVLLFLVDDPKGVRLFPGPPQAAAVVAGRYLSDPNADIE